MLLDGAVKAHSDFCVATLARHRACCRTKCRRADRLRSARGQNVARKSARLIDRAIVTHQRRGKCLTRLGFSVTPLCHALVAKTAFVGIFVRRAIDSHADKPTDDEGGRGVFCDLVLRNPLLLRLLPALRSITLGNGVRSVRLRESGSLARCATLQYQDTICSTYDKYFHCPPRTQLQAQKKVHWGTERQVTVMTQHGAAQASTVVRPAERGHAPMIAGTREESACR